MITSLAVLEYFALDVDETSVLCSFQNNLLEADISKTTREAREAPKVFVDYDGNVLPRKSGWHKAWRSVVETGFHFAKLRSTPEILDIKHPAFIRKVEAIRKHRAKCALILLELAAYDAYWPLDLEEKDRFSGVTIEESVRDAWLSYASITLGFEADTGKRIRDAVPRIIRDLDGTDVMLVLGILLGILITVFSAGMAAPLIAGLVGSTFLGLSGAAAVTAGLAALGGGAIAVGGFGMAGGLVVLVGGAGILGLGAGVGVGNALAGLTAQSTTMSVAKLEVFAREFLIKDADGRAILGELRTAMQASSNELLVLVHGETDDKKREALRQSAEVMKKSLERLNKL